MLPNEKENLLKIHITKFLAKHKLKTIMKIIIYEKLNSWKIVLNNLQKKYILLTIPLSESKTHKRNFCFALEI